MRFPISFDRWYGWLSRALGLFPSAAYVEVHEADIHVRMGWAFRARFPRSAVASASLSGMRTVSRGVHGFWGRWLVNGAGHGIVRLRLHPSQRAYVMGVPVGLRELFVSVEDAPALLAALSGAA